LLGEVDLDSFADESDVASGLLPTSLDDGQDRLDEPTSSRILRTQLQSPPVHSETQGPLRRVVGRLDLGNVQKHPQLVGAVELISTQRGRRRVTRARPGKIYQ
jgi:hypothetical protein